MQLRGIVFDLDGTLVNSALDFDRMRREMELPPGAPILEALAELPAERARLCRAILDRHERAGCERAMLMPGAREFLAELDHRGLRRAIFTRNARRLVLALLARLNLEFDPVLAREDAPAKPDPTALWQVCKRWGIAPGEVLMIGDFRFDIEAGRNAGMQTALFTGGRPAAGLPGADLADHILHSFHDAAELLDRL